MAEECGNTKLPGNAILGGFICKKAKNHGEPCLDQENLPDARLFRTQTAVAVMASLSMGFKDLPLDQMARAACDSAEALMNEALSRGWSCKTKS